jgi:hypothetical protein
MRTRGVVALLAVLLAVANARAAGVKVKAHMATGPNDDPVTSFTPNTEKIYAIFKTDGAKQGDKVRGVLIAEDVGSAAPPNTKVLDKTIDLEGDTEEGAFNFSKPDDWPVGKYRVEIYVNGELATKMSFTIKQPKIKDSQKVEGPPGD